ncbi:MAG TPA: hypothetical protein DCS66_24035 [Flavobacteriaceae bacterium]|nr:hypothetical protein [Flavobacteriaceae bacterium]HAT67629.1 hypothetical protein [Flavobacteriaceae bacterium]|tara:strand:- start:198 stop:590 length:393 start_codon:yes stop_codon:yes gene_type:complete
MEKNSFSNKIQLIQINKFGEILRTDNVLIELKIGENIFLLHPFFECLKDIVNDDFNGPKNIAFPCIAMEINEEKFICDITIKNERDLFVILLFNFSKHYQEVHKETQEKNRAMLKEQSYNFENRMKKKKD